MVRKNITINNYTDYNTLDFRKIILRCYLEVCAKQPKAINIYYLKKDQYINGIGFLGSKNKEEKNIYLWVPKENIDPLSFARLVTHELLHNLGVNHWEMTYKEMFCQTGCEWASLYYIRKNKNERSISRT